MLTFKSGCTTAPGAAAMQPSISTRPPIACIPAPATSSRERLQRRAHCYAAPVVSPSPPQAGPSPVQSADADMASRSEAYTLRMKDAMHWKDVYGYNWNRGLYYHEILPGLFCGSQPRHASDVAELKHDLGITHILSLQQDSDMQHWGVNPGEIRHKCGEVGIDLVRRPIIDFQGQSLRAVLPSAVKALNDMMQAEGRVYVHCTAGLGRAPGVIIAYLYWFKVMSLDQAYAYLTGIRPCGPKRDAVRGATFDLLSGQPKEAFDRLPQDAWASLNEHDVGRLQRRLVAA